MKEVWLLRHGIQAKTEERGSWQPGAPLTEEGRKAIQRVFQTHLAGVTFSLYGSSPFRRARETAAIVATGTVKTMPELATVSEAAWDWLFARHPEYWDVMGNPAAFFEREPGLMIAEGERVFKCVQQTASRLAEGEKALLVSHQPLIETAVAVGTNAFPPQLWLQKGEIVIFSFEGDKFSGCKHLPLPS